MPPAPEPSVPRRPSGLPSWFHADDPWLADRMRRVQQIRAAESDLGRAVLAAMTAYLEQARAAILGTGPTQVTASAVTAAADDTPPNLDAYPGLPLWARLVREFVLPVVRAVFSLAWAEEAKRLPPRPEPDGDQEDRRPARLLTADEPYQRAYLDKVADRLKDWPTGAFEKIRTELQAGLALGEDPRALRDRVGRALRIDAPSRALAAEIDLLTRTIDHPDTAPQIAREARARRAALYRRKDRADQLWWPSAARIARTEAVTALNGGTYASAAVNAERDQLPRWVQWWSTTDSRVRPSHWAAHMQVQRMGEKFRVGNSLMDHPGDPTAPAEEVVNCRCSLLILHSQTEAEKQRELHAAFAQSRADNRGRPIDDTGRVIAADAQEAPVDLPLHTVAEVRADAGMDPERKVATATWRSPLNRLGGGGGYVPTPSDGVLRHRSFPAALLWKREVSHGNVDTDGAVDVGVVTGARIEEIDGQPWIVGQAEIDLNNPDGAELARRMRQGFLRWISIMTDRDPDADLRLLGADEPVPAEGEQADTWRLGNVTVLAQPEFDEATMELDEQAADNGERAEDRDPDDVRPEPAPGPPVRRTGMIALIPADPDALVVPGGDPAEELHLTLAYLGDITEWPGDYVSAAHRVAMRVTGRAHDEADGDVPAHVSRALTAHVFSHAVFNPNGDKGHDPATVYLFDGGADRSEIEMLAFDVQSQLRNALGDIDFPEQHKPFVPHVTAGYGIPVSALSYTGPVVFDRVRVALGDDVTDYPLATEALVAAVTGNTGLPFADRGRAWDGSAARQRVAAWSKEDGKINPSRMGQAFLWRDPDADPHTVGAYRFGVADIINGRLMIVPRGVFAAAAALQGARGGTTIPKPDQARMRTKINALYRRMRQAWDDPALTPPWEKSTTAGLARRRPGERRPGDAMTLSLVASSAQLEKVRTSWADRLAAVAATLHEPPAEWFEDPKLDRPTPLTITPEGRVYGHAHDWTTAHVGYADRQITALTDRDGYKSFNLRPVRCAGGKVVRAGALCKGGHAPTEPGYATYAAQQHYDDPAKRMARVTAGRDAHGTWVAGALAPGITPEDVLALAELSLSPDWREVDFRANQGKFVGVSVVNVPGLPIVVPDEELGGYDDALALVAAGVIERKRPAWADAADQPAIDALARAFGETAGDAMWHRFLDHMTASGVRPALDDTPSNPGENLKPSQVTAGAEVVDDPAPEQGGETGPETPVAAFDPVTAAEQLAQMAALVNDSGAVTAAAPAPESSPTAEQDGGGWQRQLAVMASAVNAPALAALAGRINGE